MPSLIQNLTAFRSARQGKATASAKFAGEMVDSHNVDSELGPEDFTRTPEMPDDTDQDKVDLIRKRIRECRDAYALDYEKMILSMAFENDRQWVNYDSHTRKLTNIIDPNSDDANWAITDNQISPLVTMNTVRATQTRPDTYVAPLTEAEPDKLAAGEANSIGSHCDRLFDRPNQVREWARTALISTTTYLKVTWDPTGEADIPQSVDPQTGMPQGVQRADVGEVEEGILLATDVLVDPKAKVTDAARYIIHEKVCDLTYLVERYGEKGAMVRAEVNDSDYSSIEARVTALTTDTRSDDRKKNAAVLHEMWEKPSPRFPKGRLITEASGIILRSEDWPYEKNDSYPFVPLGYQYQPGTIMARNMVYPLIPHQRAINKILSQADGRAMTDKLTILAANGVEMGVDAYTNRRNYTTINYQHQMGDIGGPAPTYQYPPSVPGYHFSLLQHHQQQMENIAGVHDVGSGTLPQGAASSLSGVSISLLQTADQAKIALFVGAIESSLVKVKEWELALYRQFASDNIPRMVGLDDEGVPGKPLAKAMAFKALKHGACRVVVTPGSGMPKLPEAEQEQIDKMYTMGVFGDPKTPEAIESYLEECTTVRTSGLKERVLARVKAAQARNPTPEQVAQQQAEMEAKKHEELMQQATDLQAIKDHGAEDAEARKFDHEAQLKAIEHEQAMQEKQAERQFEIDKMHAQAEIEIAKERAIRALPPALGTINFTADPAATVDAEKMAGLEGKVPPTPKPATGAPTKK